MPRSSTSSSPRRRRAAAIEARAEQEASGTREAASAAAEAIKAKADAEASGQVRQARAIAEQLVRDAEREAAELLADAKATIDELITPEAIAKAVKDAAPMLHVWYRQANPKAAAHLQEWALKNPRIADAFNFDPKSRFGKTYAQHRRDVGATVGGQAAGRKARIDFELG